MVVEPGPTLLKTCGLSLALGLALALVAAAAIRAGTVALPPRIPASELWTRWWEKRLVWGVALLLTGAGVWLAADFATQLVGLRDLYWLTRHQDLYQLSRLGAYSGWLLGFLGLVVSAVLRRRRAPGSRA